MQVVTELTKTLELKLVDPNAHKWEKLQETCETYRQALQDAFDAVYDDRAGECDDFGQVYDVFAQLAEI